MGGAHSISYFFFCFFFSLPFFGFLGLCIYTNYSFSLLIFRSINITFAIPERRGSRLCSGATCQEYFWYLSIFMSFVI